MSVDSVSGANRAITRASAATARMMRTAVVSDEAFVLLGVEDVQHRDGKREQRRAGQHEPGEPALLVQPVVELRHGKVPWRFAASVRRMHGRRAQLRILHSARFRLHSCCRA